MNTQQDITTTARKTLALAYASAVKQREQTALVHETAYKLAEADKTPTGKFKRAFKDALHETSTAHNKAGQECDELSRQIISTAYAFRAADTASTLAARSSRLEAIVSGLGISKESADMTHEWSLNYDRYVSERIAEGRDMSKCPNEFESGSLVAFDIGNGEQFFQQSIYGDAESPLLPVSVHLVLGFDSHGNVTSAKIYTGQVRTEEHGKGWNLLTDNFGIECQTYDMNFNLSTFSGSPSCVMTYAKVLTLAVKVNAALRQFPNPRQGFSSSLDVEATAKEWASL
jgi:hypothetical protein